jgi:very-short-patch-repair endonuclease
MRVTREIREPRAYVRLESLAAAQHGVFTHGQAVASGVSDSLLWHRCRQGQWARVEPRVYRVAAAKRCWRQDLMAACLGAGRAAAASHRAAACLWQLDGMDEEVIELTVPHGSSYRRHVVHRAPLAAVDVASVDGIPATTPARTVVDLGAVAADDLLERALESALRRGLSMPRLQWRLESLAGRGRPGVAALRRVLARRPSGAAATESELESRFLQLVREAGLPPPVRQHVVRDGAAVVARVDFAYPERHLAIELDGFGPHAADVNAFHRDRTRQNRLVLLGWTVLRFTWEDVTGNGERVVATLTRAMAAA